VLILTFLYVAFVIPHDDSTLESRSDYLGTISLKVSLEGTYIPTDACDLVLMSCRSLDVVTVRHGHWRFLALKRLGHVEQLDCIPE
jgi:hypothetical protein